MHIAEGVLSAPVLLAGAAVAAAGVALGLRRLPSDRLMLAGMAGAAFFVASLIHVPIGVASAHLILNGLVGALFGVAAFPIILVGLLLQAVLFQFGGLTALGVNAATMGLGAWAAGALFGWIAGNRPQGRRLVAAGAVAGATGVLVAALLTALALAATEEGFVAAAAALFAAHLPVMAAEGVITALVVGFLAKARPSLFDKEAP